MSIIDSPAHKLSTRLAVILIVLITALAYAGAFKNSFVWDDYIVIVDNGFVKSWQNLPSVFGKDYLSHFVKRGCCFFVDSGSGSGETSYRPLVTLSYFIDYSLWGLNPFGYHLTSLLLHITGALLFFFLVNLMVKNKRLALLSSLLFSLHPVNSEAVNVISFREELLVFASYLSSFILYIKLKSSFGVKKAYFYILSLILFLSALFSKEMAVTLPVMLMLYDYFFVFEGRIKGVLNRFKSYYLGYIAALFFYLWVRFIAVANITEPAAGYPGGSLFSNILTMSRVLAAYIRWTLLPVNIPVIITNQPYLVSDSLFTPQVSSAMILITVCVLGAIKIYKFSKYASFFILWFFITLLPVSNIVPIPNYIAGRYLYLPVAGFCFTLASFMDRPLISRFSRPPSNISQKIMRGKAAVILTFYFIFTSMGTRAWENDTAFYLRMTRRYPDNALAYLGLGDSYKRSGLLEEAVNEYKAAIKLNSGAVDAYNNLGIIFGDTGRYEEAIDSFKGAIKVDPGYLQAYNNLAVTYTRINKWSEARKKWEEALRVDSDFEAAKANLQKLREMGY